MKTPLPQGETRTPLLDIQVFVDMPIDRREGFGIHVFFEEARTPVERDAAIDRAFVKLATAIKEVWR